MENSYIVTRPDTGIRICEKLCLDKIKNKGNDHSKIHSSKNENKIIDYVSPVVLERVRRPTSIRRFPLYEKLRISNSNDDDNETSTENMKEKSFIGTWVINLIADTNTLKDNFYQPEIPCLIDITSDGCEENHYIIRGRVFNMTVSEFTLNPRQNSIVFSRAVTFYSDFVPLNNVQLEDKLMNLLIENVSLIYLNKETDELFVSTGTMTVQAQRYML
jgi:hypothetical protein